MDIENKIYEKMDTVVDIENCTVSCKTTHFSSYSAVDEAQYDEAIDDIPDYMVDDHGNDEWQGEVIAPEQFLEKTRAYNFSTDLSDLTALSNGKSLYVTKIRSTYNMVNEEDTLVGEYYVVSPQTMYKTKLIHIKYYTMLGALVSGNDNDGSLKLFPLSHKGTYKVNWNPQVPYYDAVNEENPGTVEVLEKYYIPAYYFDSTDTDSDMLLDVYEALGMRITNGARFYTDFENPDIDNDGMLDGEEIYRCNVKDGFFALNSYPNKTDSDEDGIADYYDPNPLIKIDEDRDFKVTDVSYGEQYRIETDLFFGMRGNWEDAKIKLEFDNSSYVSKIDDVNKSSSTKVLTNDGYCSWDVLLDGDIDPEKVKYTVTITNKGKEIYKKRSTLSAPKLEFATNVRMKTGEEDALKNCFVYFEYNSKYAKTSYLEVVDAGGNIIKSYDLNGIDAKKYNFTLSLYTWHKHSLRITVNKGLENEYSTIYPIDLTPGADIKYPMTEADLREEQENAETEGVNVLTAVGLADKDNNCVLSVNVNEPNAENVYVKIQNETGNIVGTADISCMKYDDNGYISSFMVENNNQYTITATINKGMPSENTVMKKMTVKVDNKELLKSHITPMEAALMADHIYNYDDLYSFDFKIIYNNDGAKKENTGWYLDDVVEGMESFKMGIYKRGNSENIYADPVEYALVFAGTTWYDITGDWKNNIEQYFSSSSVDMHDAVEKSRNFVNAHLNDPITMVGHSKGGAEAMMAAVENNKDAYVFNPARPNFKDYINTYKLSTFEHDLKLYVVENEVLSDLYEYTETEQLLYAFLNFTDSYVAQIDMVDIVMLPNSSILQNIAIQDIEKVSKYGVKIYLHTMSAVIKAMKEKGIL